MFGLVGVLFSFRCNGCGDKFSAGKGFSVGWSGDTYANVVCAEHGIGGADTGVNLNKGGTWEDLEQRKIFPCRQCGTEAPLWDEKSCPKCGSEALEEIGQILFD